ncbi:MAG: HEAT repeat domain-containing protein, partial [Myxococcota bacterium]
AGDPDRILDSIALLEEEGGSGSIAAITTVIERSDDPEMKIEAIDSLAFLADEGDVSRGLQAALGDPSPDVRIEAADVIVELELTELLPDLHTRSYQESDPDVREVIEDAIFELEPVDQDERG